MPTDRTAFASALQGALSPVVAQLLQKQEQEALLEQLRFRAELESAIRQREEERRASAEESKQTKETETLRQMLEATLSLRKPKVQAKFGGLVEGGGLGELLAAQEAMAALDTRRQTRRGERRAQDRELTSQEISSGIVSPGMSPRQRTLAEAQGAILQRGTEQDDLRVRALRLQIQEAEQRLAGLKSGDIGLTPAQRVGGLNAYISALERHLDSYVDELGRPVDSPERTRAVSLLNEARRELSSLLGLSGEPVAEGGGVEDPEAAAEDLVREAAVEEAAPETAPQTQPERRSLVRRAEAGRQAFQERARGGLGRLREGMVDVAETAAASNERLAFEADELFAILYEEPREEAIKKGIRLAETAGPGNVRVSSDGGGVMVRKGNTWYRLPYVSPEDVGHLLQGS